MKKYKELEFRLCNMDDILKVMVEGHKVFLLDKAFNCVNEMDCLAMSDIARAFKYIKEEDKKNPENELGFKYAFSDRFYCYYEIEEEPNPAKRTTEEGTNERGAGENE